MIMTEETNNSSPAEETSSTPVDKKRKYAHLSAFLSARVEFLYYTQSNLTRVAGFNTRQAINERMVAACNRVTTHDWWEAVLLMPKGSLEQIGVSEKKVNAAIAKYNNDAYYKGPVRASIVRAVVKAMAAAVSPWDVAIRQERMNRKAADRTRLLNEARKRRADIYGF
jgi:hypothetical protein